jgi:hypothetical protein
VGVDVVLVTAAVFIFAVDDLVVVSTVFVVFKAVLMTVEVDRVVLDVMRPIFVVVAVANFDVVVVLTVVLVGVDDADLVVVVVLVVVEVLVDVDVADLVVVVVLVVVEVLVGVVVAIVLQHNH